MVGIVCPICEERVQTNDIIGLGNAFKDHLMVAHKMDNLSCVNMTKGVEPAKERVTYEVEREVTVERPLTSETVPARETMEEQAREAAEGVPSGLRTTRGEKVVGASRPEVVSERAEVTAPLMAIQCPFCNTVLRADDEDDLGDDLKDHWGDVHQLRPTIRAEMGMGPARGRS
jgi:predicted small metal-binding protein